MPLVVRLTVLGSGDAFNASGALHSGYLLEHSGGTLLLECGPTVLAAMKRHRIATDSLDAVLVSHLHGDHFAGLPFLFLEYRFVTARARLLEVAGPSGIGGRVEAVHALLYRERLCQRLSFGVRFRDVRPGQTFELAGFAVEAFEVPHPAEPYSLGYRLRGGGATIVFSGDAGWTDDFLAYTAGADLFLCECSSVEPASDVHVSYRDVLERADRIGCRTLLTHLGPDVRALEKAAFELATDGLVLEIGGQE